MSTTRNTTEKSGLPAHSPGGGNERGSLKVTSIAGAALIALWVASWGLSDVHLGDWSLAVALAIAVVKAAIVLFVFMEIAHESTSTHIAVAAGLALVVLLVSLMVADVKTRAMGGERPPSADQIAR